MQLHAARPAAGYLQPKDAAVDYNSPPTISIDKQEVSLAERRQARAVIHLLLPCAVPRYQAIKLCENQAQHAGIG